MSNLTDYSKFDHLTEDSDDESREIEKSVPTTQQQRQQQQQQQVPGGVIRHDKSSGRYRFEYNGNLVYEFEQNLDDVTIYVVPPPHVTKGNQIRCVIAANRFKLGLVGHGNGGQQWFLNEETYGTVDVDESTWTLEDDDTVRRKIIVITLAKANRGTLWEAALRGNPATKTTKETTMDELAKEQVKKDLMLQRFHEENPGFDFSGAEFNGSIPDARDFMGGVKYQ